MINIKKLHYYLFTIILYQFILSRIIKIRFDIINFKQIQ